MFKFTSATAAIVLCGLMTTASYGQLDGLYEFDGDVDNTWENAANWEQVSDPNGNPISGDPATPPDGVTSADIGVLGVTSTGGANTALDVSVGTASGAGSLTSSGTLAVGRDIYVGGDASLTGNLGTMTVTSGSVTAGDDINVGMTDDVSPVRSSPGVLNVNGGTIESGDDVKLFNGATLNVNGGTIISGDNFEARSNTPGGVVTITVDSGTLESRDDFRWNNENVVTTVTVNGGLLVTLDKLLLDDDDGSMITINGGTVRAEEYAEQGPIEINGDGLLQFESNKLSPGEAIALFGTTLTTTEAGKVLGVQLVTIPDFFGETNLEFTQISVVPEPASALLISLGALGFAVRRRR